MFSRTAYTADRQRRTTPDGPTKGTTAMDEYVVVIETGYRLAAATHKITATDPLPQVEANQLFQELLDGMHAELLPAKADATYLEVSPTEFMRVHSLMGGVVVMDRVTLARVH